MLKQIMDYRQLRRALSVMDLTDVKNGAHPINLIVDKIIKFLSQKKRWPVPQVFRRSPLTSVENNFDRLLFPADNPGRSSTYTRYVSEKTILRTHTSAVIPEFLEDLRMKEFDDSLVCCPGICYRREIVDKQHSPELHQIDIWRVKKGPEKLLRENLIELIESVIEAVIPGYQYRANEVTHPYTLRGLEVEIFHNKEWIEILECGELNPVLLKNFDLDPVLYSGLAMGIGLDRLVMIAKGIDDIRILRSKEPRITKQMSNLDIFIPVSKFPSIKQDMSISVGEDITIEDICDKAQMAMDGKDDLLEDIILVSETKFTDLPEKARERLNIKPGQKNLLIRVVFRSHARSLLQSEANEARDLIYESINETDF